MHHTALVRKDAVRSHEGVAGNGLTEDLNAKNVGDDVLSLAIKVCVHESDVVVGCNAVSESGQTLLNTLHNNSVRKSVTDVLQLTVRASAGKQKAVAVTNADTANKAAASDGSVDHRDLIRELGLEDRVKSFGSTLTHESVGIGDAGPAANLLVVLKGKTVHGL